MKARFIAMLICLLCLGFTATGTSQHPFVCDRENHTGNVALTDLGKGTYQGFQGGLYPGGLNNRPAAYANTGIAIGRNIKPLDASGKVDMNKGIVVMVSLGMSNAKLEFDQFILDAKQDTTLSPKLALANGAEAGEGAEDWLDPSPDSAAWFNLQAALKTVSATDQQVQIVWIKQALLRPTLTAFPTDALTLQNDLRQIVLTFKTKYPNTKLAYISSRIYGGYSRNPIRAEPLSYGFAWSTKWIIENYINGDPALVAGAPYLTWGPYMWADGVGPDDKIGGVGGRKDGLEWACEDFSIDDGFHPSPSGDEKVSQQLLNYFKKDPTSAPWFLKAVH